MKDYYSVLGLKEGASLDEIKKAYKKYAAKFHPDKHKDDEFFKERFQEVQEAYEFLKKQHETEFYEAPDISVSTKNKKDTENTKNDNYDITFIKIPYGTTHIDKLSENFKNYDKIITIEIPNTVISIGEGAFKGCSSLAWIDIPNSVKWIEAEAFYGCSSLEYVNIPFGVESIGVRAFANCSKLTSVTTPRSVKWIGKRAFDSRVILDKKKSISQIWDDLIIVGAILFFVFIVFAFIIGFAKSCNKQEQNQEYDYTLPAFDFEEVETVEVEAVEVE